MHPSHIRRVLLTGVLVALPLANGCMWAPELTEVKQDIAGQMPDVGFKKNVTLSLGPMTMALARTVTGLIPEAHEARGYLRDVSRVQVAVYQLEGQADATRIETPSRLEELQADGWEMAIRVNEENQRVWLLYRANDDTIREMFVVVVDDDQLVLVKVKGHLERLMAEAIRHSRDEGDFLRDPDGARL
ncbi:MAG TPA: DUF4252 domain-containing protein [Candidatus Krumholzibacteria bacterium]|nr:DUF4252 domain-containing protein [Candidatus Krumholzibacteria bacterium]